MDRRNFVTWITGAGATLALPSSMRPTMKWKPAQQFWVSHRFDWVRSHCHAFSYRESKEMIVPVTTDHPPSFGYGSPWETQWLRDIVPNFSLGVGMPDAALSSVVESFTDKELLTMLPKHATTSRLHMMADCVNKDAHWPVKKHWT